MNPLTSEAALPADCSTIFWASQSGSCLVLGVLVIFVYEIGVYPAYDEYTDQVFLDGRQVDCQEVLQISPWRAVWHDVASIFAFIWFCRLIGDPVIAISEWPTDQEIPSQIPHLERNYLAKQKQKMLEVKALNCHHRIELAKELQLLI